MPDPVTLTSITNKQKMVGLQLKTVDTNGNQVALPNSAPIPSFDQQGVVEVQNMTADPSASPANSVWTFDIVGLQPSSGPVTISMQTHQSNGTAGFIKPLLIQVTLDPSIPGPAADFVVTPGQVVSQ